MSEQRIPIRPSRLGRQLVRAGAAWVLSLTVSIATAADTASVAIEPDVVYGHKDGLALTLDVYRPADKPNGAGVLFMVSGGWYSRWSPPESHVPLFEPYLDAGYTVFAVRHGSSPRYTIPEAVGDARRAVRFVRHHASRWEIAPDRLGAMGMSAGGHLALMLGTTGDDGDPDANDPIQRTSSRLAAVVALVPPTDLRVAVWEAPESLPVYRNFPALDLPLDEAGKHSPLVHVSADDAPALVVMGGDDELVPPEHGEWVAEALHAAEVPHKLLVVPDAGHNVLTPEHRESLEAEMLSWFDAHLAPPE